jgi:hypothetical protein
MTTPPTPPVPPATRRFNPHLVALLTGLFLIICVLVILTDILSQRNRAPNPSTFPATSPTTAPV